MAPGAGRIAYAVLISDDWSSVSINILSEGKTIRECTGLNVEKSARCNNRNPRGSENPGKSLMPVELGTLKREHLPTKVLY